MNIKQISSGVTLCSHETSQFKTSCISLNLITEIDNDVSAKSLLINLLARTTNKYPSILQISRKLASLYGANISAGVEKVGESQVLKLTLSSIDDRFTLEDENISRQCIKLLCDCLFDPQLVDGLFTNENLEREKRLLCEKIEAEKDDKRLYALGKLHEYMCCDEKFGQNILGDVDEIKTLTSDYIYQIWKRTLKTAKIQINVIGSSNLEEIETMIKSKFNNIIRESIKTPVTEFVSQVNEEKLIEEKQNVKQGKLVIGFRTEMEHSRDNLAAMKMMTAIFGSGTFSKLFVNVREKMGLCYYCSAGLNSSKGILTVQSGVETENMQKALDAILNEVEQMKKGEFTDEVIENAKLSFAEMLTSVMDSVGSINSWFTSQVLEDEYLDTNKYLKEIKKVTKEQIVEAANTLTLDTVYILKTENEETKNG